MELQELVEDFAGAMKALDATHPVALNARTKEPFQPGIGPHQETRTIELVANHLKQHAGRNYPVIQLEVPYPSAPRSKCDICVGGTKGDEWAIEIKMLRVMGDNNKPNDNSIKNLLSPYPKHRSALTDCDKLFSSGFPARKAILIYGYEHDEWLMEPMLQAFESLARHRVELGERYSAQISGLVHPVHQRGGVFAWEITALPQES